MFTSSRDVRASDKLDTKIKSLKELVARKVSDAYRESFKCMLMVALEDKNRPLSPTYQTSKPSMAWRRRKEMRFSARWQSFPSPHQEVVKYSKGNCISLD